MPIYILKSDANKYQNIIPLKNESWDIFRKFNGTRFHKVWIPLKVTVVEDDEFSQNRPPSDFPALASHIPVFSQRAVDVLNDILVGNGELFPVVCQNIIYFAYNVNHIDNVLDINNSKVERFKSSGRIMEILEYKFLDDQISSLSIFKLPETSMMDVFVTDKFVHRVQESKLIGFRFQQIYPLSD